MKSGGGAAVLMFERSVPQLTHSSAPAMLWAPQDGQFTAST
jgi:hypothetical protein